ncbi:MAG TPA: DEAD/DEAH box helicase [bacterium]|nr:DEAD/DEAH box helicase [bacterium]
MNFVELNISAPLLAAVDELGYAEPTPIQQIAIPHVLSGCDVLGCAQTGTGKTAAFALPILQRLAAGEIRRPKRAIRALIVAPTRELASQIDKSFADFGKHLGLKHTVIFGGVPQKKQVLALSTGIDILVATPGRLLDLKNQRHVDLKSVEILVLDEADRMLDMGFINDIRRIVAAVPEQRQTLMFSATVPSAIRELAGKLLHEPREVSVAPSATTVENVEQWVYFVEKPYKMFLLAHLLAQPEISRALVFTRTKYGADKVVRYLANAHIPAEAIHGDKTQKNRERVLNAFKHGKSRVLVATDLASRGLDIDDISHVVNFDLPNEPESYVHRIGRTARAGSSGAAYSFCGIEERPFLFDIEKLIRMRLNVQQQHPYQSALPAPQYDPTTNKRIVKSTRSRRRR